MNKNKKVIYLLLVVILIITFIFILQKNRKETIVTNSNATEYDNKKIGWGIKRSNNNEQPDLGSTNKKLIDENGDIAMGNKEDKFVYLTFDEGYEAGYTEKILDTLKANEVTAAFFITGHYLNTKEELVKRMIDEGHIVGNHTVNHKR